MTPTSSCSPFSCSWSPIRREPSACWHPGWTGCRSSALDYLQLVGPAVLTAIAAVSVIVITSDDGHTDVRIGVEWLAVIACLGVVRGAGTCCSGSWSPSRDRRRGAGARRARR